MNSELDEVIPQQIVDDTKKLELSRLVATLLQCPDNPRVQNLIAARIYTLGAKHMLDHMMKREARP